MARVHPPVSDPGVLGPHESIDEGREQLGGRPRASRAGWSPRARRGLPRRCRRPWRGLVQGQMRRHRRRPLAVPQCDRRVVASHGAAAARASPTPGVAGASGRHPDSGVVCRRGRCAAAGAASRWGRCRGRRKGRRHRWVWAAHGGAEQQQARGAQCCHRPPKGARIALAQGTQLEWQESVEECASSMPDAAPLDGVSPMAATPPPRPCKADDPPPPPLCWRASTRAIAAAARGPRHTRRANSPTLAWCKSDRVGLARGRGKRSRTWLSRAIPASTSSLEAAATSAAAAAAAARLDRRRLVRWWRRRRRTGAQRRRSRAAGATSRRGSVPAGGRQRLKALPPCTARPALLRHTPTIWDRCHFGGGGARRGERTQRDERLGGGHRRSHTRLDGRAQRGR